ncbi:MAG: sigma-70 family RNA polymerase sigma factor [Bacteroidota bacterium]
MVLVQRGDHRAFSVIYDRYATKMKAFFYRMLWSNGKMAEDFVHDLFTRIIERPDLYDTERMLSPWLYQVASNMCKNAYRKREFEVNYLNQLDTNGHQYPVVDDIIDQEILTHQLHELLGRIGEEKRELFLLRYQQELSVKELMEVYKVTEGTIKSRLFYIRKALLEELDSDKIFQENGR